MCVSLQLREYKNYELQRIENSLLKRKNDHANRGSANHSGTGNGPINLAKRVCHSCGRVGHIQTQKTCPNVESIMVMPMETVVVREENKIRSNNHHRRKPQVNEESVVDIIGPDCGKYGLIMKDVGSQYIWYSILTCKSQLPMKLLE
ncbi:unnamed protein product [Ambrosiozyma monospora]|uniref:Unnamed protein product n=1 Tax=Ambrosiozyma monospora TaxID=43982 RepID=A0ACB5UCJ0_AMBMO|nr:unnamed protein product [Ambrosiozyma monospora]